MLPAMLVALPLMCVQEMHQKGQCLKWMFGEAASRDPQVVVGGGGGGAVRLHGPAGPSESAHKLSRPAHQEWARRRQAPRRCPPLEAQAAGVRSLRASWSWAPCYLSDDLWAGSGNLALRAPPAEICLLSQDRAENTLAWA